MNAKQSKRTVWLDIAKVLGLVLILSFTRSVSTFSVLFKSGKQQFV